MNILEQEVKHRPQATGVIPVAQVKNNNAGKVGMLEKGLKIGTDVVDYIANKENKEMHKEYNEAVKEKERIEGINRGISFTRTKDMIDKQQADFRNSLVGDDFLSEGNLHAKREQWKKGVLDIVAKDGIMDVEQKERMKSYINDTDLRSKMEIVSKSHAARKEKYETDLFNDLEDKKISVGTDIYNGDQVSANNKINGMKEQYKLLNKLNPNKYNKAWLNKQNSNMVIYAGMGVINKAFKTSADAYMENPTEEGYRSMELEIAETQRRLADPEVLRSMFGSEHGLEYEEFLDKSNTLARRTLALAKANGNAKNNGEKRKKDMKINDIQENATKSYAASLGETGDLPTVHFSPEATFFSDTYSQVNEVYLDKHGFIPNNNQELFEFLSKNPDAPKFSANIIGSENLREIQILSESGDYKGMASYIDTMFGSDRPDYLNGLINEQLIKQSKGALSVNKVDTLLTSRSDTPINETIKKTLKANYDPFTQNIVKEMYGDGNSNVIIKDDNLRLDMEGLKQLTSQEEGASLQITSLTKDINGAFISNAIENMTADERDNFSKMHKQEKENFLAKKMNEKLVKEANEKDKNVLMDYYLGKDNRAVLFKGNTSILNNSINPKVISAQISDTYYKEKAEVFFEDEKGNKNIITNGTMLNDSTSKVHFKNNEDGTASVFFMDKPVFKQSKDSKKIPLIIDPQGKRVAGLTFEEAISNINNPDRESELIEKFENNAVPDDFLIKEENEGFENQESKSLMNSIGIGQQNISEMKRTIGEAKGNLTLDDEESVKTFERIGESIEKFEKGEITEEFLTKELNKGFENPVVKELIQSSAGVGQQQINDMKIEKEKIVDNITLEDEEIKFDNLKQRAFETFEREYKTNPREAFKTFEREYKLDSAKPEVKKEAFKTFEREYKLDNVPTPETNVKIEEAVKEEIDLNTPEQSLREETVADISKNLVKASEIMGVKTKKLVEAFKMGLETVPEGEVTEEVAKEIEKNSIVAVKTLMENKLEKSLGIDLGTGELVKAEDSLPKKPLIGTDEFGSIENLNPEDFGDNQEDIFKGVKEFVGKNIDNMVNSIYNKDTNISEMMRNVEESKNIIPINYGGKKINKTDLGNNISNIMQTIKESGKVEDPNIVVSKTKEMIRNINEKSKQVGVPASVLTNAVGQNIQNKYKDIEKNEKIFNEARPVTEKDEVKTISTLSDGRTILQNSNGENLKPIVEKSKAQIEIDKIFNGVTDTKEFKRIQEELNKEIEKYPKEMWEANTKEMWENLLSRDDVKLIIEKEEDEPSLGGSYDFESNSITVYPRTGSFENGKMNKELVSFIRHEYRHFLQYKFGNPKGTVYNYNYVEYEQDADIFANGYDLSEFVLEKLSRDVSKESWEKMTKPKRKWFGLSKEIYLPKSSKKGDWRTPLSSTKMHDFITDETKRKSKEGK